MLRPFREGRAFSEWGKGWSETPPPPGGSGEWSGTPPPSWHLGGKIFGAADFFPLRPTAPNFFGFPDIRDREEGGWSRPLLSDPRSGPSSTLCTFFRSHNALLEGLCTSTHSFPGPWGSSGISRGLFLPHRIFSCPLASFWYPWRSLGLPELFWETWESFVPREGIGT